MDVLTHCLSEHLKCHLGHSEDSIIVFHWLCAHSTFDITCFSFCLCKSMGHYFKPSVDTLIVYLSGSYNKEPTACIYLCKDCTEIVRK